MKKLSNREKIILVIVIVAVLYGVYELVLKKPAITPERDALAREQILSQTDATVATVSTALRDSEVSPVDVYVIELAGTGWPGDPFYTGMARAAGEEVLEGVTFMYSGYLEVGSRRMAIINGVDYRVGEAMDVPGFVLQSVSPRQVVIADKEGRKITVPFVEE